MKIYDTLKHLAERHRNESPEAFAKSYREAMAKVQSCFGEPGYGPVASLDTENADNNRKPFVQKADTKLFAN